ncbi:DUF5677 domain-containing protein [Phreatobacter sp. AB_2022a]|uniref:DUF5677 domain-containing protein n=1 Tax=Phreatobacter sp. AB_2022a TaxID=3003134 RepID=UPI00228763E5|nr:DUF5677 domain-containing protein [Phreatobacter sp. AB_2022a]MCZ0733952.1 DUF5677 domain-containing protein [Phreatobacter sp. AB_2022a]
MFLLRGLLPEMTPVARHPGWTADQRRTLGDLLSATARSTESALLLTAYAQLWDAEILVRSVFEGSLKVAYLLQSPSSFEERHREYGHDLFRISLLKDHAKYAELLGVLPSVSDPGWRPFRERLLAEEEREEIATAYPKQVRSSLESRWGFTGLIGGLARSGDPIFKGFTGLATGYSMASHIAHADSVGTSIAMERDYRSAERRDAISLAHGVRLMTDVMVCFHIRLAIGYRFISRDPAPVARATKAMTDLKTSFGRVYEDWMEAEYGTV